jgi:CheY-like chemotaxis protein
LRVLLAEDTTMNQTLIRHIFARMGYVIEIVNNGLAAVESAREADYDLILMDIQMPGMDGIEACTHILAEASARGTRPPAIVAVTANASVDNRQQCLAAGMCDFIPKPFTLDRLHQVVSRMGDDADSYHVSQVSS